MQEALTRIGTAVTGHISLLDRIVELSDQLLGAIHDEDFESMQHLLQARSVLLNQLPQSSTAIRTGISELRSMGVPPPDDADWVGIQDSLDRADRLENAVLQKQTSCEYALSLKMDACRKDMSSLSVHKSLTSAYQPPQGAAQARFLDNKL